MMEVRSCGEQFMEDVFIGDEAKWSSDTIETWKKWSPSDDFSARMMFRINTPCEIQMQDAVAS